MKKTKNKKYLFQEKKINFTKRLFENGLNATSYILFAIKDFGEDFTYGFLEDLPNSYPGFRILKSMFGIDPKRKFNKKIIKVNFSRLIEQGLVVEGEKEKFILSAHGEEMVAYIKNRYSVLDKPWDKKTRIVIFDIPEYRRRHRVWLRKELFLLKFKQLQKSVYVGKYPIPDELYQDIVKNEIFKNVYIFTVNEADKEDELLKFLEKDE